MSPWVVKLDLNVGRCDYNSDCSYEYVYMSTMLSIILFLTEPPCKANNGMTRVVVLIGEMKSKTAVSLWVPDPLSVCLEYAQKSMER